LEYLVVLAFLMYYISAVEIREPGSRYYILLRFSRGFTQSQFNSTINKFIYTLKHSVQ